jgi:hypothetical protein
MKRAWIPILLLAMADLAWAQARPGAALEVCLALGERADGEALTVWLRPSITT